MAQHENSADLEAQLQLMDVHVVDVLAHLEALLRHSHSIQRALLQLRADAPPPATAPPEAVCAVLRGHAHEMTRECNLLRELIDDLNTGVETIQQEYDRGRARSQQL